MRIYLLLLILFLTVATPPFVAAQIPTYPPTNSNYPYSNLNSTAPVVFIVVVSAFLFTGFFAVCIRHCYYGGENADGAIPLHTAASRPRRLFPNGLDPAALNSLPIFNYSEIKSLKFGKGELSCAVCVSEFEDNERLRLLPACGHVFHSECVDLWLASHSTCPICRANLTQGTESTQSTAECDSRSELSEVQNQNQILITVVDENQGMDTEPRERARRMFPRSHSTGHSLVRLGEEDCERYTLRLREEVRRQVDRIDRKEMTDRWFLLTMTPPFISRSGSLRSAKVSVVDGEIAAVGTSRVFLTSVKSPFGCVASKTEQMSTGVTGLHV